MVSFCFFLEMQKEKGVGEGKGFKGKTAAGGFSPFIIVRMACGKGCRATRRNEPRPRAVSVRTARGAAARIAAASGDGNRLRRKRRSTGVFCTEYKTDQRTQRQPLTMPIAEFCHCTLPQAFRYRSPLLCRGLLRGGEGKGFKGKTEEGGFPIYRSPLLAGGF